MASEDLVKDIVDEMIKAGIIEDGIPNDPAPDKCVACDILNRHLKGRILPDPPVEGCSCADGVWDRNCITHRESL